MAEQDARRSGKGLGTTQRQVLHLIASIGTPSVRDLARSGFGLTESAIRGAINCLGARSLCDVAGMDVYRCRTFRLTTFGAEVESSLLGSDCDGEDGEAPMAPPVDLSEVPTPELIHMLYAAFARLTVATRLAGLSREPIR